MQSQSCPCTFWKALLCLFFFASLFPARSQITVRTSQPRSMGSISYYPELGILTRSPVGDTIQATYFRTTAANREFRRGIIEFSPQVFNEPIYKAWLVVEEWSDNA